MSQSFDYRAVLKPRSFLLVFNPNKTAIQKDYNGNTYTFPAEGTREITEAFGRKHTSQGVFEPFPIDRKSVV